MNHTLYLSSTPLHSFFALGLMNGACRDHDHTLALVDQHDGARDYIGDALEARSEGGWRVHRYAAIKSSAAGRRVLQAVSALSRDTQPSHIAVGNDCRLEFYAAIRGWPRARRVYMDDGLYSYLPHRNAKAGWREAISNWRRGLKYGLPLERPSLVGGSRAVQQAYVLLPQQVHAGLLGKAVQTMEPDWFTHPTTQSICADAAALAGFDATGCTCIRHLLLLPHPQFLANGSPWAAQLGTWANAVAARGETLAVKPHPAAHRMPLSDLLPGLPPTVIEVPARLPIEVLLPWLSGAQVVGAMTTALLTLRMLGQNLGVHRLPPMPGCTPTATEQRISAICASIGIQPLSSVPHSEAPSDT